ncbi:MAG: UvrD-helicase domain-containing protein [Bacteroidales bacterium]|nr:UvrD-helicase domain-containing protein [Bacteroidales bacterium]
MRQSESKIIEDLNDSQKEAVINYNGPVLILAGAGAGKTRVITHRIAYMLLKGIKPYNIMALTFTNKAANEMKTRIAQMINERDAQQLWIGTFHSIFNKILKNEYKHIDYLPNYTIYDTEDSKNLIKKIINELQLDTNNYKPDKIQSRISKAKNDILTPTGYYSSSYYEEDCKHNLKKIIDIYSIYQSRLKLLNVMDFDDLLLNTYLLLKNNNQIREKYKTRFKYIMVDEYQDTNLLQYKILRLLTDDNSNICVVGDDSQSIYSFRGARIENILNFKNDYNKCKIYTLNINYRSTKIIVDASNLLISKNVNRLEKEITTINDYGEKITVLEADTPNEEAESIANIIKNNYLKKNKSVKEIAILYRTNAQSRVLEEAMLSHNIPYKVYGAFSFYQRKEIKDIIAYIRICINPDDNEAIERIINFPPRGIGEATLEKLRHIAYTNEKSLWQVINDPVSFENVISKITQNKLLVFRNTIKQLQAKVSVLNATEFIQFLLNLVPILQEYNTNNPDDLSRKENLEEFITSIYEFTQKTIEHTNIIPTIIDFYESISLLTQVDEIKDDTDNEKVKLMTVHCAKGLEFDTVFIAGASSKYFPLTNKFVMEDNTEEERRLFYVALTRARKKVYITYAKNISSYNYTEEYKPSFFISELGKEGVDFITHNTKKTEMDIFYNDKNLLTLQKFQGNSDIVSEVSEYGNIKIGSNVIHQKFGIGKIISIQGHGDDTKAIIDFSLNGRKTLLLKYAKLKVIYE